MPDVLKYNPRFKEFVLFTQDAVAAEQAGFTKSTTAFSNDGTPAWFTDSKYAALRFRKEADPTAAKLLAELGADYDASWATTSPNQHACREGETYMPFQNAGIDYCLDHENALIGDEPGLGKSGQAVGVATAIGAERVLIVCPASIRRNWKKEIVKWSPIPIGELSIDTITGGNRSFHPKCQFVIVSYDLTRNEGTHRGLCSVKWDLAIFDEVHYAKSQDARRTQALFGGGTQIGKDEHITGSAKRVIGLTGTPLPNRPRECYTVARALCWEAIDWWSYDQFCHRFNPSARLFTDDGKAFMKEEKGRLPELQARLRCNFMVRRMKADVLKDLPDKRYELTYVEPNGKIGDVLARERLIDFDPSELKNPFAEIWGQVSTVRREMGEAMAPRAVEHVEFLLDIAGVEKVVVFSHHRSVWEILADKLAKYGVVGIRGGMSDGAKAKAMHTFINDPRCRVFSGQLDAAGFGIDGLQNVASHVVFAEPAWTPGTNEQAVDRCHRIGQHNNVLAQFLVVEGSFNERILAMMIQKTKTIHTSLDELL